MNRRRVCCQQQYVSGGAPLWSYSSGWGADGIRCVIGVLSVPHPTLRLWGEAPVRSITPLSAPSGFESGGRKRGGADI